MSHEFTGHIQNGPRRDARAKLGSAGDGHGGLNVGGEFPLIFGQGPEIALDLDAVPEFCGLTEKRSKADRHGGRDGTAGMDDFVDGTWCDANGASHGVLGNAHGHEVFFQKNLAGRDGWLHRYNVLRYRGASMVITNGDLGRAMFGPDENDPPLVVDADRMVTGQISLQSFEPVSRRDRKILENPRPVHLDQLAQSHACDCSEAAIGFSLKQLLGVLVGKGLDHGLGLGSEAGSFSGMFPHSRAIFAARERKALTLSSITKKAYPAERT